MVVQDNNLALAKDIILESFSFLEKRYYYTSSCFSREDETFIEWLEIEYTNTEIKRNISVSCTKGQVYDDIKYTFSVSITRIPYSGVEDFFSLGKYLQSIGNDFETSLVNHFDKAEAEKTVNQIVEALKKNVLKIIEGSEWLEAYYPEW